MRQRARSRSWKYLGLALLLVLALGLVPTALRRQHHDATSGPFGQVSAAPDRPVAVFVGDSSVGGAGATSPQTRWSGLTSAALGWDEVSMAKRGYAFSPAGRKCDGASSCRSYVGLVPAVVRAAPQVVVVGSRGDAANSDDEKQAAQVASFFQALRLGLPDATIIAVGPWSGAGRPTPALVDLDAAVRSSVGAVGGAYVSLLSPALLDEKMTNATGSQLNDLGHQAVAGRVVANLGSEDK